jgi:hypothetical protein
MNSDAVAGPLSGAAGAVWDRFRRVRLAAFHEVTRPAAVFDWGNKL